MGIAKQILKFWPLLIIFLSVAIFSFPFWAKGLVPFPSSYLTDFFPPWNAYYGHPVKNNAMPDVISQIYPWRQLTIESFKLGQWPLWNPYNFAGNPHLANVQSAVFHPLNWLFFLFSQINAWSLVVLLQPLLAAGFTYLFCRELKISQTGSLISSLAFGFCGFMVVWMAYGTLGYALLWLPLILYGIERLARRPSALAFLLISFGLAFSLFSGHFQISLYVFFAALAYLLFRRVFKALWPLALGIALAAPQLLPAIEFYRLAPRSEIFLKGEVIPWRYLVTVIAPDFFGNPVTRNDWFGHYAEWASFVGVIPLLLGIYAFLKRKGGLVWFWAGLGVLALGLALPTPILDLLIKLKVPVLATSAASRVICLFSFSMAILAGIGFDQLKKDLTERSLGFVRLFLLGAGILVLAIWGTLLIGRPFPTEWLLVAKRNFILPTGMVGIFGGSALFYWFFSKFFKKKKFVIRQSLFLILLMFLLLTAFDLLRFATKWMPFDPREHVYPSTALFEFLKKEAGHDRVFGNFGTETQVVFHLPAVEGYDPLYPERYGELITSAGDGRIGKVSRSTVYLNKNGQYAEKMLGLLGVKYLLHAIGDGRNVWAFPFWQYPDQFKLIYQDEKHEVYENQKALPRAFMVYDYQIVKERQEIIDQILAAETDLNSTIILEEEPDLGLPAVPPKLKPVEFLTYSPNQIDLKVETEAPGLLFLSDNYYPGWKALIDGRKKKIYRADYSFRAVVVPEGEHQVSFIFDPPSFKLGLGISFFSLMALGLTGLFWRFKR